MSNTPPSDQSELLAAARQIKAPPPYPRVSPPLALLTSPTLHRLVPWRLIELLGRLPALAFWYGVPSVRANSRATMDAIVGGTPRAQDAHRLARARVIEAHLLRLQYWQQPARAGIDETSRQNLAAALQSGRGVILSSCHLGPYFDVGFPLTHMEDRPYYAVAGDWFFEAPSADYQGRRLAFWWRKTQARNHHPLTRHAETIQAMLAAGERVVLYFDVIGRRETVFLGKPMRLADGTARLALSTGALVVPVRTRRVGAQPVIDAREALDPARFSGVAEMHQALADIHSELVLELPETLEDPRRPGAWEHGATAESWMSPSERQKAAEAAARAGGDPAPTVSGPAAETVGSAQAAEAAAAETVGSAEAAEAAAARDSAA